MTNLQAKDENDEDDLVNAAEVEETEEVKEVEAGYFDGDKVEVEGPVLT